MSTIYRQVGKTHVWGYSESTTAGNAITLTEAMTLDASGNLGIDTTSTGNNRLIVSSAVTGSNNTNLRVECTGSGGSSIDFASGSTGHVFYPEKKREAI